MSVMIRMSRGGKKNSPRFDVVVKKKRSARNGGYIERIGYYNPSAEKDSDKLVLDKESYEGWVKNGAEVSETIKRLAKYAQFKTVNS